MEDQLKEAEKLGLKAMQLGKGDQEDIRSGRCQLVYGSPESWLLNKEWRVMLATKVFQENVLGIVVDEVHLTYKWGKAAGGEKAFRESFARLAELRSIVKQALGMGLNFPNISHVVMYGSPVDVEAMVQEVGRAGRDGSPAHAIIYKVKQYIRMDEGVKILLNKGITSCLRKELYSHFEHNTESVLPGHLCCSYCHSVCSCSSAGCDVAIPEYELINTQQYAHATVKSREVTEDQKKNIRDLLYRYKLSLVQNMHLYTNSSNCTGFSNELIDCVVERCTEIFDLPFIMDNLPVFSKRHGVNILRVLFDVFGDFECTEVDLPAEDIVVPDQDYTGYFDDDSEPNTSSQCSSLESGFSLLSAD
ncbi:Werner syndrome ATP-dependent helicase [Merluccius polli]|uniref:DNA 3'-5' helicase n=1 Tax=Merluccius polli TaxID=89951 RepID=A0AA47NY71_MERPO|nr:Werner syndrome ATP-dependent helicase [Merluccius polli]